MEGEKKKKKSAFKIKRRPGSQKSKKRPYVLRKKMSLGPKDKHVISSQKTNNIKHDIKDEKAKAKFEKLEKTLKKIKEKKHYNIKIEKHKIENVGFTGQKYKMNFSNVWNFGEHFEIFSTRFSPDDTRISFGLNNGIVEIFSILNKKRAAIKFFTNCDMPVTNIRWLSPSQVYASNAEGYLVQYDINKGILVHSIKEEDNQILAMDHCPENRRLATSGKDCAIRIYDDETKKIVRQYNKGGWYAPGHSNRVFGLKFKNNDHNILLSGGWDNSIFIWDIRQSKYVAAFAGCSVSGDTIDSKEDVLLIGSHRSKDPLELFDFGTRKRICVVDWNPNAKVENAYVYACQFSNSKDDEIVAGCSVRNEVKVFKRNITYKPEWTMKNFKKAVYCLDCSSDGNMMSVGGADGNCYLFKKVLDYD